MYAFRHSTGKTQSAVVQTCWGGKTHITRCQNEWKLHSSGQETHDTQNRTFCAENDPVSKKHC